MEQPLDKICVSCLLKMHTRERMALKNVQKIKEKYDIHIYIEKLKNLYREILGEKP